ncbi:MAG: tol-pal system protein YbgF [Pseudolabrys sp.]|nr:tol-pal system protein YbgF [Pseudolabrys sp.]
MRFAFAAAALSALLLVPSLPATAQDRGPGFLDNLFSRGEGERNQAQRGGGGGRGEPVQADPNDASELTVRIDRLENALRQLTGTIERLQYSNQQLEQQVRGLSQMGGGAAPPPVQQQQPVATPAFPPRATQPPAGQPPAGQPGRRGDVFDPSQQPDAPGAPRTLGSLSSNGAAVANEQPIGAPGGREAGSPLDLATLSANAPVQPSIVAPEPSMNSNIPGAATMASAPAGPVRAATPNPPAGGRVATLPPSASPQDEYDLAYGYVLHKDYAQAEAAFRDFIKKYPNERLQPDAQYWLGESFYQRQRYRDAAESFLAVSTKHDKSGKAPDSLLRLGQSLAAMNQKEAACATLSEVGRKYPKASGTVKRGVEQEIKRAKC